MTIFINRSELFNDPVEIPRVSTALVLADNVCDYIPLLSSITNAVNLCLKYSFSAEDLTSTPISNLTHYKWHIQEKSSLRCVILMLIPAIGNFIFAIYDCININYSNEAFVIAEVSQEDKSSHLKHASLKQRSNPRVIYAAINGNHDFRNSHTPQRIQTSNPYQLLTVRFAEHTEEAMLHVSPLLRQNLEFMRSACTINGMVLKDALDSVKRDYQAAGNAVAHSPGVYRFVDPSLREGDSEQVIRLANTALVEAGFNIAHVPVALRNDRAKALEAVRLFPAVLQDLPQFQDDEEFADVAMEKRGSAYEYISLRLKQDRNRAMEALKNGCSLKHMPAFIDDEALVLYAINLETKKGNCGQIKFASARLKNEDRFAKQAARRCPIGLLEHINPRFSNDRKFIEFMIEQSGLAYNALPDHLRGDIQYAIKAFQENPMTLRHIPPEVQNNPQFIEAKQRIDANRASGRA